MALVAQQVKRAGGGHWVFVCLSALVCVAVLMAAIFQ